MPRLPSREEVQTLLSALLITRKEAFTIGVPVAQLDQDYREQEGTRIPFRQLGYTCLLDLLESMSGGLCLKYKNGMYYAYPLVTEKSRHVSQLVAGQNSKRSSHSGRRTFRPSPCYPRVAPSSIRLDSASMAEIVRMVKESQAKGVHKSRVIEYARYRLGNNVDVYDLGRQLREVSHEIVVDGDMIYPASRYLNQPRNGWMNPESQRQDPPPIATENRNYPNARPGGFSDSETEDRYDEEFAVTLVDMENTHPSRQEHVDTPRPEERSANDENENRPQEKIEQDTRREENESIAVLISERTRFRLQKLIEKHPDGIWCADLPALYQQAYTIPLNYEELGFPSVIDYARHLPDIFHYARLRDKGDFKLFDANATKPNIKPGNRPKVPSLAALHNIYEQYVEPTEPIPSVLCQSTVDILVPDGVMTIGETVAQICVTELDRGIHDYIDVIVSDVFTPSFFWIQLLKRIPKFNLFMNELHAFYEIHANKYTLPLAVMEKGMNCACMYDGKWHRGIVKKIRPDSYVTVMFYDYGTVRSYPPECIHFLHRSFSNLPAQAIPCGLYNLKPTTGTRWSRSVACEFVARATNVPLVATIASIDTDNNSMMVCLTNTEENEDFHITDWMVQNGLAIYGKMVRIRPPNYPYRRFLDCNFLKSSDRGEPSKSGDSNNVNLVRTCVGAASASVSDNNNAKYYENLLKLCRESRAAKSTSILSIRKKPGKIRKNSLSKDSESRVVESRERKIVEDDCPVHEATSRHAADDSCADASKKTRPRMRREIFMRRYESVEIVHKNGDADGPEAACANSTNIRVDEASRNDCKEISNGFLIDEGARADCAMQLPLHLVEVDGAALTEFGTLRSRLGGCGRMERIDWSVVRATLKRAESDSVAKTTRQPVQSSVIVPENNEVPKCDEDRDVAIANDRPVARSLPYPEIRTETPVRIIAEDSPMVKTTSKLPNASNVFSKIVNKIVSGGDENSDLTCVPDGNIKSGSDLKPSLRAMTNKLSEELRGSTKIFIPNSLLKLMSSAVIADLDKLSNEQSTTEERNNEEKDIVDKALSESLAEISTAPSTGTSESNDPTVASVSKNSRDIQEQSTSGYVHSKVVEDLSSTMKRLPESEDTCGNSNVSDKIRKNSARDINDWLKTVRIQPRNQQLFNLIASCLTPNNNSELDSDDLSIAEEENKPERNATLVDGDSAKISTNLELLPEKIDQVLGPDNSAVDLSPICLGSESLLLGDLEIPNDPANKDNESCVRSSRVDPIVDDIDMESDRNTWDCYYDPKVLETSRQNLSDSSDSSRSKIDNDPAETEHKYDFMDETVRSNRTGDSTFAERESSNESLDAPPLRNLFDDRQPLIDPDEDSTSGDETAERGINPIGESGDRKTKLYPILSEIKKSNISNTSKAFVIQEGTSSSEKSDCNSRSSLVNTIKKAFLG